MSDEREVTVTDIRVPTASVFYLVLQVAVVAAVLGLILGFVGLMIWTGLNA